MAEAAIERGFNVVTFEDPDRASVSREQIFYFIKEWESDTSS